MLCAISAEVPQEPVISTKTGHLYEKRIIEKHLRAEGRCPMTGAAMSEDDLMTVQINKALRPRSLVTTSIPGLLSSLQNEWDELMLETFALKSQVDVTRQELAQALYQHDASCRVIARLMRERDEARAMLAAAASSSSSSAVAMDVPDVNGTAAAASARPALSEAVVAALNAKCGELSGGRKGRAKAIEAAGLVLTRDELAGWAAGTPRSFTPHKSDKGAVHCAAAFTSGAEKSDVLVTGGADGVALLLDAVSGAVLGKLAGHSKKVNCLALRSVAAGADGKESLAVFTGSADKTVKLWVSGGSAAEEGAKGRKGARKSASGSSDLALTEAATYSYHTGEVTAVAVHPTGDFVLTASLDGSWGFVDVAAGACVAHVSLGAGDAHQLLCGQLHPDGLLFATGTAGGAVKVWDVREQKSVLEFASPAGASSVRCLSFSENGYVLAAGGDDGGAHLWDLRKLKTTHTVASAANSTVTALAFDYSGSYLALGSDRGDVRVAAVKDWAEPLALSGLHSKAVTALCWGGQAGVGVAGKKSYLVSCSLDRSCKVVGGV